MFYSVVHEALWYLQHYGDAVSWYEVSLSYLFSKISVFKL